MQIHHFIPGYTVHMCCALIDGVIAWILQALCDLTMNTHTHASLFTHPPAPKSHLDFKHILKCKHGDGDLNGRVVRGQLTEAVIPTGFYVDKGALA